MPETLNKAPSRSSTRIARSYPQHIIDALYPPYFHAASDDHPGRTGRAHGCRLDTFALHIPAAFQRDVLAGRAPVIQPSVDATRMSQAFTGSGHIQVIVQEQVNEFVRRHRAVASPPVELALRARFNHS